VDPIELLDWSEVFYSQGNQMRSLARAIGALVVVASAISFAAPGLRLVAERAVLTPAGLDAIAGVRIAIGLVFVLAAPASRAPWTLRVLGVVIIVAGVMTPWFGVTRARAVLDWWATASPLLMRLEAGVAIACGGALVYLFGAPPRPAP
jgi:hypothetical protein